MTILLIQEEKIRNTFQRLIFLEKKENVRETKEKRR